VVVFFMTMEAPQQDGGLALLANLSTYVGAVVVDSAGNLYIEDTFNSRIRKVTTSTGIISTVVGNGTAGYSGDGGPATSAEVGDHTQGVAIDSTGNLYIVDRDNNCIRKVTATTGVISTVAGNGTPAYSGDGGPATSATLNDPTAIAIDTFGNIYIADTNNCRVRKVMGSTGIISTVAGNGAEGTSGDGGSALSAEIGYPYGLAVDSIGKIYI
jgi:sugar lactone lactonase YvrE